MSKQYGKGYTMKEDIKDFAKIGLVHHMLYSDSLKNPAEQVKTLQEFVKRKDISTFDCCLPYGKEYQLQAIQIINDSDKEDITFAAHFFPARKLSFASIDYVEQAQARMIVKDMIEQAIKIKATGFIFPSCGPSPENATKENYQSFKNFCRWLCSKLEPHGITALLEPFDTSVDKKFLYGSTDKCVELIHSLKPEISNLAIELDMAHIPLMGETFEQAIKTTASYLKRVHLGNCILKEQNHPLYGDKHPPIGYPGGEINRSEMTEILSCLLEIGYLNKKNKGCLILEMISWPGKSVDDTITDSIRRLEEAWKITV